MNKWVFLWQVSIVSKDLIVLGSWFQNVCKATQKTILPNLRLILGAKSCLEMDDLRVLDISKKCSRLTKDIDKRIPYSTVSNMAAFTGG